MEIIILVILLIPIISNIFLDMWYRKEIRKWTQDVLDSNITLTNQINAFRDEIERSYNASKKST